MKKNMYSLMLSEEVVRAVDTLAAKQGTNRSNLVNQILAEHLSLVTPEKHVRNVFDIIEQLMGRQDFLLFSQPNDLTMSIKSSLRYHYRPTIRYEVEMYRTPGRTFGQLKISYRTTSAELLVDLTRFFKIWMRLEEIYVAQFFDDGAISYWQIRFAYGHGKQIRRLPERRRANNLREVKTYERTKIYQKGA